MNQPVLTPVHSLAAAVQVPLGLLAPLGLLVPLARAALAPQVLLAPLGLSVPPVLLGLLVLQGPAALVPLGLLVLLAPVVLVAYKTNQWGDPLRHNLISEDRAQARVVAHRLLASLQDLPEARAALRRMIADVFLN
jgi:hypothetical protein